MAKVDNTSAETCARKFITEYWLYEKHDQAIRALAAINEKIARDNAQGEG